MSPIKRSGMTTQAEIMFPPLVLELLDKCAGYMALGFGGSGLDLSPLRPVFDTPPHLDLAKQYLRTKAEERSKKQRTLRDIDPALLLWHTFGSRALYVAVCPFDTHEGQIEMIEDEVQPYVLAPFKGHFMPAEPAPAWAVGRNRERLKSRAA